MNEYDDFIEQKPETLREQMPDTEHCDKCGEPFIPWHTFCDCPQKKSKMNLDEALRKVAEILKLKIKD